MAVESPRPWSESPASVLFPRLPVGKRPPRNSAFVSCTRTRETPPSLVDRAEAMFSLFMMKSFMTRVRWLKSCHEFNGYGTLGERGRGAIG